MLVFRLRDMVWVLFQHFVLLLEWLSHTPWNYILNIQNLWWNPFWNEVQKETITVNICNFQEVLLLLFIIWKEHYGLGNSLLGRWNIWIHISSSEMILYIFYFGTKEKSKSSLAFQCDKTFYNRILILRYLNRKTSIYVEMSQNRCINSQ